MAQAENPGRERILARIREALREPAPRHASGAARPIFAPVPEPLDRFQRECGANNTECIVVPDAGAGAAAVAGVLSSIPTGEIFVQDAPELRRMADAWRATRGIRWSTAGGPAESSQATITLADVLVAQTGSVFVSSSGGGRGASIVAPVHIVVASLAQLVPGLDDAFARLRERDAAAKNSMLCLITGSSRTADIEKILVLGAHGPRRLVVVLMLRPS
ncbi:MAG TPA: LUD domain-containing protein [Candidatus Acidoferrales bacterium]|nr:LUD domain-containing protein [Candidatus Acidoferrales bacterium]